jgi:hypothetical protein
MIRATLAQTNHFVLQKNYLTAHKAANLNDLLHDLIGLPSSDSMFAAQARLPKLTTAELNKALYQEATLMEATVMRNERYLIRVADYPSLYIATLRQRKQEFNAQFRLWGVENDAIDQLGEQIMTRLADQPRTHADLIALLPDVQSLSQTSRGGRTTHTTNAVLALAWLMAQGKLATRPQPHRTNPLYLPMSQAYPQLDLSQLPSEADAQCNLVRAYLAAFGPVNEADVSLWTGLSKSETARAMGALTTETTLVLVEGLPGMLLLLKNQAEALTAMPPFTQDLNHLLPTNDPYITAHRASRGRYFTNPKHYRQVFNSAGVAQPTMLLNGQVIGTWDTSANTYLFID